METGNLQTQTRQPRVTNQCITFTLTAPDWVLRAAALTGVQDPLDDCGHLSLQHGVQQLDDEDQAGAEHQQRESQQDQTYWQVRQIHIHKEMLTCAHTETHTWNDTLDTSRWWLASSATAQTLSTCLWPRMLLTILVHYILMKNASRPMRQRGNVPTDTRALNVTRGLECNGH